MPRLRYGRAATHALAAMIFVVAGCASDKPAQGAAPGDGPHVLLRIWH
ncbi:hypothetical protein H7J06_09445 [Mycobacterium hodleri]|nr:hypothetical protein [Mycolicibacterium hodleri]MCV7133211.1 hypothetical protein [Mycolicibacterium hodleri]